MKSRVKQSPAPPELKTLIYEQPGEISEITAKRMMDIILAYAQTHPEEIEEMETQKGKIDYVAK